MTDKEKKDSWLDTYRRVRKGMPPPTSVKPGKKGKGVPYKREKEKGREGGEEQGG